MPCFKARAGVAELFLERELVVARGLDPHQQAVERRDIATDGATAALERLHERRPRARERIEHRSAAAAVAPEQRFHELWDELPEIRMERWTCFVRSRSGKSRSDHELEVQAGVESVLRRRHRD